MRFHAPSNIWDVAAQPCYEFPLKVDTPNNAKSVSTEIITTCLRAIAHTGGSGRIYNKLERPSNVTAYGILGAMCLGQWLGMIPTRRKT